MTVLCAMKSKAPLAFMVGGAFSMQRERKLRKIEVLYAS